MTDYLQGLHIDHTTLAREMNPNYIVISGADLRPVALIPIARPNSTEIAHAIEAIGELLEALEMVRDADEDCRKDGLQTMPPLPRAKIDRAIAKATGEKQ